ncbi:reverse transcriptase domain-containing protein [Tanacetum coccineum]
MGSPMTPFVYISSLTPCNIVPPNGLIVFQGILSPPNGKYYEEYGLSHRFSTSYHPQTSGQVENTNRALKRIIEKIVKDNPAIWLRKLDDAQ